VASPGQGQQRALTGVLQPRTTGKLLLQSRRGAFCIEPGSHGGTGTCSFGELGCEWYHGLSSGRRCSILHSKEGSARVHARQSAQKPRVLPWASRAFHDRHFPKRRAASGRLGLCFQRRLRSSWCFELPVPVGSAGNTALASSSGLRGGTESSSKTLWGCARPLLLYPSDIARWDF